MLNRILVENFGPFKLLDLEFTDNLTVIHGKNGVGKTQLIGSIIAALNGKCTIQDYKTKLENNMKLGLYFKYGNDMWHLSRTFENDKFLLTNRIQSYSNESITDVMRIDLGSLEPALIQRYHEFDKINLKLIKETFDGIELVLDIKEYFLSKIGVFDGEKISHALRVYSGGERYIINLLWQLTLAIQDNKSLIIIDEFGAEIDNNSIWNLFQLFQGIACKIQIIVMTGINLNDILHESHINYITLDNQKNAEVNRFGYKYDSYNWIKSSRVLEKNIVEHSEIIQYVLNTVVALEENIEMEFKEVKGNNPTDSIISVVDQYVVAYLNSNIKEVGKILWGICDNRTVVGVKLEYSDRDKLRREISNKLTQITPPIPISFYKISLIELYDSNYRKIENYYIVEVSVNSHYSELLYATGKDEVFIKTDGGKRKLKSHELQLELKSRYKKYFNVV